MKYDPRGNAIWGMTKAADEGKRRYDIYGYTGKEREQEIGLAYFGARWYNADMGRFISCDPISTNLSSPQNLNKYHYCLNSPVNYVDLQGLWEMNLYSAEFSGSWVFEPGVGSGWFYYMNRMYVSIQIDTVEMYLGDQLVGETQNVTYEYYNTQQISQRETIRNFYRQTGGRHEMRALFYSYTGRKDAVGLNKLVHSGFAIENIEKPGTDIYYDMDTQYGLPDDKDAVYYKRDSISDNEVWEYIPPTGPYNIQDIQAISFDAECYYNIGIGLQEFQAKKTDWEIIPIGEHQANCVQYSLMAFKLMGYRSPEMIIILPSDLTSYLGP